jgi:hypothetical protein
MFGDSEGTFLQISNVRNHFSDHLSIVRYCKYDWVGLSASCFAGEFGIAV